ncbi:hypothetical protein [Bradyrhizobium sp.]|uniref:hypothetical protein n=1 Tax=Bradyrhizobium sp. TaxID=376 RepID=UPI003C4E0E78
MSAPEQDEKPDSLGASVPPGIGVPQRHNEVRRIQERIAALTRQHETSRPSSQRRAPSLDPQADIEAEFAMAPSREPKAEFGGPHEAWARTLDPVVMPPPPQRKRRSSLSRPTVAGSIVACCIATGMALAMINSLRAPIVNTVVSSGGDADQSQSLSKAELANLTQIPPAGARAESTEQSSTSALSVFAALQTNDPAPAQLPAPTSAPGEPGIVVPETAFPEPPAIPILSHDEVTAMLRRSRDLIAEGDIASARLILQHVAEAGSAAASLALARTFDPAVLARLGVIGAQPDPAKARAWYAKAADQEAPGAQQRLQ